MENNNPTWHDAAYKLSQENNLEIKDYTPDKGICLKDFEPETFEKNKELLSEFETRVRNTFAHLVAIYHNKNIVIKVLTAYYESVLESELFTVIAQNNAALYIELKRIFLVEFYEARKNIGKGYDHHEFL